LFEGLEGGHFGSLKKKKGKGTEKTQLGGGDRSPTPVRPPKRKERFLHGVVAEKRKSEGPSDTRTIQPRFEKGGPRCLVGGPKKEKGNEGGPGTIRTTNCANPIVNGPENLRHRGGGEGPKRKRGTG